MWSRDEQLVNRRRDPVSERTAALVRHCFVRIEQTPRDLCENDIRTKAISNDFANRRFSVERLLTTDLLFND